MTDDTCAACGTGVSPGLYFELEHRVGESGQITLTSANLCADCASEIANSPPVESAITDI